MLIALSFNRTEKIFYEKEPTRKRNRASAYNIKTHDKTILNI